MLKCTICIHPKRKEIDQKLIKGVSFRDIAGQYGLSKSTVERHTRHIKKLINKAQNDNNLMTTKDILNRVSDLQQRTEKILTKVEKSKDWKVALTGIREVRQNFELIARVLGIGQQAAYEKALEFLREAIRKELEQHPKVQEEVIKIITEMARRKGIAIIEDSEIH